MKPPINAELQKRLEQIESHLAHLERQYDDLNAVVIEQGKQIRKLQTVQQRTSRTVETIELERINATNAKPPHYQ